jgi:hypothetical protein
MATILLALYIHCFDKDDIMENFANDPSPFLTIWFQPRKTIRNLITSSSNKGIFLGGAIWGIMRVIEYMVTKNAGFSLPLWEILSISLVGGTIAGIILMYIAGFWFTWIGKLFGGKGTTQHLRLAYAWAVFPEAIYILLRLIQTGIFGIRLFQSFDKLMYQDSAACYYGVFIGHAGTVILIWVTILMWINLSEAHQFSKWKSLVVMVITGVVCLIGLMTKIWF